MNDQPMKPLLMCGAMVRARLAGRKTATRRVMVPQPVYHKCPVCTRIPDGEWLWTPRKNMAPIPLERWAQHARLQPGDLCYVRERQRVIEVHYDVKYAVKNIRVRYEADGSESDWIEYPERCKWYPKVGHCLPYGGIHETARLFVPISDTRAERLQDISEEDAIAEGMNVELLAELIEPLAARAKPKAPYWRRDGGDDVACYSCAKKKKWGADNLDGGWTNEEDGAHWCECGKLLDFTLTDYGVETEFAGFEEAGPPMTPDEAYVLCRVLGTDGNPLLTESCGDFHYMPEMKGRVARLCFRALWDGLNGKRGYPWASNPWILRHGLGKEQP
jgi:hypothetical protein